MDQQLTQERFRCLECKHRGPALCELVTDYMPYGEGTAPLVTLQDPVCEACGSPHVIEIDGLVDTLRDIAGTRIE